ncbi:hypothetical protein GCM10008931_43770 [Oceanobacillus oncorhynchi subsp. oncorhynchi]|uniref:hypothetical protein n=1 Tax=Oceanobacillus oncorhynchi TaxID=545501 RepID=UPI0031DFA9FE
MKESKNELSTDEIIDQLNYAANEHIIPIKDLRKIKDLEQALIRIESIKIR